MATVSRETVTEQSKPTKSQIKGKTFIATIYHLYNKGTETLNDSGLTVPGIQDVKLSPSGGNEEKIFQQGANSPLIFKDNEEYSGSISVLGNDLTLLLAMDGKTSGAFNSTDGYGASGKSDFIARGFFFRKILIPKSASVARYEYYPEVYRESISLEDAVDKYGNLEVPIRSTKSPIILSPMATTGTRPVYDFFAYSAGNSYVGTHAAKKLRGDSDENLPDTYDQYLIEVRKFSSATDEIGTVMTSGFTYTAGTKTLVLTTNIASGEFIGVAYLGEPA